MNVGFENISIEDPVPYKLPLNIGMVYDTLNIERSQTSLVIKRRIHMKDILLAILLFVSFGATAQKNQVVTVDTSKAKMALFNKTLSWVEKTWGTLDNVVAQKDEEAGQIVVKGGLKAVPKTDGYSVKGLTLTELTITIEKGKVQLDFSHTAFTWSAGTIWNFEDNDGGAQKEKWKADVASEMENMLADYKAGLAKNDF